MNEQATIKTGATPIPLSEIRTDGGTQARAGIDQDTVDEYASAMNAGDQFPPIVVFHDGETYWLADGFHRVQAAWDIGWNEFPADVKQGAKRDAILYGAKANATHGLRLNNKDKRHNVMRFLEDEEWSQWSDREIARHCGVSNTFVGNLRASLSTNDGDERRYVTKHGTVATMDTSGIVEAAKERRSDDRAPVPLPDERPDPTEREADEEMWRLLEKRHAAHLLSDGRVKRPVEIDGKLYASVGGFYGAGERPVRYVERLVPLGEWPGRPYTIEEVRKRKEYGSYYHFGFKVSYGSTDYVLDPRDRIVFLGPRPAEDDAKSDSMTDSGTTSEPAGSFVSPDAGARWEEWNMRSGWKCKGCPQNLTRPRNTTAYRHRPTGILLCPNHFEEERRTPGSVINAVRTPAADESPAAPPTARETLHSSEDNEWYTPEEYVDAVWQVLGKIDLDPASCAYANETVEADNYFTAEEDGLSVPWSGRVFLNPPYGKEDGESNQARWSHYLIDQYDNVNVEEAILLVNATPGNRWWAPLWRFPICFVARRIHFYNGDGQSSQATHSNAFVYLGPNGIRFARTFKRFGPVVLQVVQHDTEEERP